MAITVGYLQGGTYTAAADRAVLDGLMSGRPDTGAPRAGVFPATGLDLKITAQATPNMTVVVFTGNAVVAPSYLVNSDAGLTRTITAASSSLPRIDRVVLRVHDVEAGDADDVADVVVLAGTPAASPSPPAVPSRCLSLATVLVSAGATSINNAAITDGRVFTAAAGGMVHVPDLATGLALPIGTPYYDRATGLAGVRGATAAPVRTAGILVDRTTTAHVDTAALNTEVTELAASFVLPSARLVQVILSVLGYSVSGANRGVVDINVDGVRVCQWMCYYDGANTDHANMSSRTKALILTAGSHTTNTYLSRSAGAGTTRCSTSSNVQILDLGPA